ncbi:antibiotic biosynthesis monooxygenase [Streptomyces sp. NBC_00513]|uniref:putative quinol monooxygenase n=1 Tax=unclassified Streptomyces TaxID=2593676 RepID=UPI00224EDF5F|nr:putative quinol monooxygenase [Streptomyces sp. NBC_00424]MCX5071131.1 antibiotic biosynthesis monooxygenase [Streptomyces sp. NBC_00424]WUD45448.1 antibiotic biosynthesis monooxygenase [Streptomyces sp. NBC_00513]
MSPQSHPLVALARVRAKPERREALREVLSALVEPSRAETGCFDYTLFELLEELGTFYVRETWADQEALDYHMATPHFQAFAARFADLLAEPIRLIPLREVTVTAAAGPA